MHTDTRTSSSFDRSHPCRAGLAERFPMSSQTERITAKEADLQGLPDPSVGRSAASDLGGRGGGGGGGGGRKLRNGWPGNAGILNR